MSSSGRSAGRGLFVVLEGIDGSGTTTQSGLLARALRKRGMRCQVTCEPSKGPIGKLLRRALRSPPRGKSPRRPMDAVAMALLFAADRSDHVSQVILPRIEAGVTVLCDRYVLSSIAYQGLDLDFELVTAFNARALAPDLTLFLDVPPRVAQRRRAGRSQPEIFDALTLQQRVDRNYRRAISHRQAHERIAVIDGTPPPEAVTAELLRQVEELR